MLYLLTRKTRKQKVRRAIMLRYPRKMHGGELWAIIEILAQV